MPTGNRKRTKLLTSCDPHADTAQAATIEQMVQQRLVRQMLASVQSTLVAGLVVSYAVAFAVYRTIQSEYVFLWIAAMTALTFGRIGYIRFLRKKQNTSSPECVGRQYALTSLVAGSAWTSIILLDHPNHPIATRLLILITLLAMPVASLSSNAMYRPVFYAFSVPIFAGMLAWSWWFSPEVNIEFVLISTGYIGLVAVMANRYNENLKRSIQRDIENERLLHEVSSMNAELQRLAYEDPLTGLSNRRSFEESATELLQRLRGGDVIALMLIDMDNFKWINDSLGHAAGDEALVTLSRRIDENSRLTEMIAHTQMGAARIGGDEFIVLYRIATESEVEPLAKRILDAVTAPMSFDGIDYEPSVSIGIALAPTHAMTLDELLKHADTAMYQAKSRGGHCYVVAKVPMEPTGTQASA